MRTKWTIAVTFLLLALAACAAPAGPGLSPSATPSPTPRPAATERATSTPVPDSLATQDAARLKMTVQAYQTRTAAEKATERAGGNPAEPITPENVEILEVSAELTLEGPVYGIRFSPDSRFAVVLTDKNTLVIDLVRGETAAAIDGDVFQTLVFNPVARWVAASSENELVIRSFAALESMRFSAHTERINAVAFSPDGGKLVTASEDGTLGVWDSATGERLITMDVGADFGPLLPPGEIWFSPDGEQAGIFFDNDSTLWVGPAATLLAGVPEGVLIPWVDHAGPVAGVEISPDWKHLAWISRGTLQLMTSSGDLAGEPISHEDWIMDSAFLPEENAFLLTTATFANGVESGLVIAYDLDSGEPLYELTAPGAIYSFTLSPDHSRLLTGHRDGAIRLWNVASGEALGEIRTGADAIQSVIFSPDGRTAASIDSTGLLLIWDAASMQLLKELSLDRTGYLRLAFNADGSFLVLIAETGEVSFFGIREK